MSESTLTPIAILSDDSALHRLFEISGSGAETHELALLDALVYERLSQTYDEAVVSIKPPQAMQSA